MAGINADIDPCCFALKIVSFNMHGFNQGWLCKLTYDNLKIILRLSYDILSPEVTTNL